jgi:hypothetical protein
MADHGDAVLNVVPEAAIWVRNAVAVPHRSCCPRRRRDSSCWPDRECVGRGRHALVRRSLGKRLPPR